MPDAPTPARERILDAYETLLIDASERAATLDAVARAAGVSKGGLLYHFGSKDALVAGLLERLEERFAKDRTSIRSAEEGVVRYFLRTSIAGDGPFDRTIIATAALAQGDHRLAREALGRLHDGWYSTVLEAVGDPLVSRAIVLMSDGLYYNSALLPDDDRGRGGEATIDDLLTLIDAMLSSRAGSESGSASGSASRSDSGSVSGSASA